MKFKKFVTIEHVPRIADFCGCVYVLGCKLSVVRLCDIDFGITPVDDITIGITCAVFCFLLLLLLLLSSSLLSPLCMVFTICATCNVIWPVKYVCVIITTTTTNCNWVITWWHVSKLNFKNLTKLHYCESAVIVRSVFQTTNALSKKKTEFCY